MMKQRVVEMRPTTESIAILLHQPPLPCTCDVQLINRYDKTKKEEPLEKERNRENRVVKVNSIFAV